MKNIVVIGGGAAGMMAAAVSSKLGNNVTLIEQNHKLGKKIYITGKGRCNLTNNCDVDTLIANTKTNPYFLYSAFYTFDCIATIDFFEGLGLKTKTERGNRVYPVSEKSSDVVKVLENELHKNNVFILLNTKVIEILKHNNKIIGVKTNKDVIYADSVIIATGGISYPLTGSTGDGHKFAKILGHKVTKLYPSLVPLKSNDDFIKDLQGLSLKNVSINVYADNEKIFTDFGEMMFTHLGLTGPIILTASRYITDKLYKKIIITIDLKPALDDKQLDARLLNDFTKYQNKDFKNSLDDLLPQKLIKVIVELSKINHDKKVNEIKKEERKNLVNLLKNLPVNISETTGFNEAVITFGGVDTKEIDPSTLESKLIKNLYFAGEVIDVDSFTGGFNLQIAFSTGYLAGINA